MNDSIPTTLDAHLLCQLSQSLELKWRDLMSAPFCSRQSGTCLEIDGVCHVRVDDAQFVLTPLREGTYYDLPACIREFSTYSADAAIVKALAWMLLTIDEMC